MFTILLKHYDQSLDKITYTITFNKGTPSNFTWYGIMTHKMFTKVNPFKLKENKFNVSKQQMTLFLYNILYDQIVQIN